MAHCECAILLVRKLLFTKWILRKYPDDLDFLLFPPSSGSAGEVWPLRSEEILLHHEYHKTGAVCKSSFSIPHSFHLQGAAVRLTHSLLAPFAVSMHACAICPCSLHLSILGNFLPTLDIPFCCESLFLTFLSGVFSFFLHNSSLALLWALLLLLTILSIADVLHAATLTKILS